MARRRIYKQNRRQKANEQEVDNRIYKELDKNITNLKNTLGKPYDLIIREFVIGGTEHKCAVAYIDGLVNGDLIHSNIVKNVQWLPERKRLPDEITKLFEAIYDEVISAVDTEKGNTLDDLSHALLSGDTIFYLDGMDQVLITDTKFWKSRGVEEHISEPLMRGSRDGVVENREMIMIQ